MFPGSTHCGQQHIAGSTFDWNRVVPCDGDFHVAYWAGECSRDKQLPEGGSFEGAAENINLANGNVSLSIPLLDLPQLGSLNFKLGLLIDSKGYSINGGQGPTPDPNSGTNIYYPPGFQESRSLLAR